jgi:hypothetical protein
LHQIKKLLYIKGNNHQSKDATLEWETIFGSFSMKGLIFKTYKEFKNETAKEHVIQLINGQMNSSQKIHKWLVNI